MSLRHTIYVPASLALVIACEPVVPSSPPVAQVTTAVFDPQNSKIPLPNDLLLAQDPTKLPVSPAQIELVTAFIAQHGFPNDQEVPLTIDFQKNVVDPTTGKVTTTAPMFDLSTFTSSTVFVWGKFADGTEGQVALAPITTSDYADMGTFGELTLHHQGRLPWASGQYALLVRGGSSGLQTADQSPVYASQVFYLLLQGQDLSTEQNVGLLAAQLGSYKAAREAAIQLNALSAIFKATVYPLADRFFPHEELAIASTFAIAPRVTQVELDPGRGLVPLPIDLLRDQKPGGTLTPLAACTLANGALDAQGMCKDAHGNPNGAAAGFATLNGFSTTGAIIAPSSELLAAQTITHESVKLFEIPKGGAAVLVDPRTYITEPCEVTSTCSSTIALSPAIVLQPSGVTAIDPTSVVRTRPLKDDTDYAVIITTDVRDKTGAPIAPGTAGKILLFSNPVLIDGKSALQGVDDATAAGLEAMRMKLAPVVASSGIVKSKIAMAYTFHTQAFLADAAMLAALPYTQPPPTAAPGMVATSSAVGAFEKYGLDPRFVPHDHIAEILETTITTFNLLDPTSGAFNPNSAQPETIDVLISVPPATTTATCSGPLAQLAPLHCAPIVVFRHGLGGGRADMLTIADTFAQEGLAVVAIDAAKHGHRAYCKSDSECATGMCQHDPALAHQGDAPGPTPGRCMIDATTAGKLATRPVDCPAQGGCPRMATDGIPLASSNFLISANFFRTRDTFRQDAIDQSQLIRALAFAPMGGLPTGHTVFDHTAAVDHVVLDPTRIYYIGQSLGSLQGAMNVASNPRISKAVFNVPGASGVDVFTTSPAFAPGVNQLLLALGVERGTAKYLQFVVVAKTILDPGDPMNYVGHLSSATLPNLLPPLGGNPNGSVPQLAKKVLAQVAYCDQVIPNPFGYLYGSNAGTGPIPPTPAGVGTFELFIAAAPQANDCPIFGGSPVPASAVRHGFLTGWVDPVDEPSMRAYGLTIAGQRDAARFLATDTAPPQIQVPVHP